MFNKWYRWLFRRCMDCGYRLNNSYDRGDVCKTCFDNFNGLEIDQIIEKRENARVDENVDR